MMRTIILILFYLISANVHSQSINGNWVTCGINYPDEITEIYLYKFKECKEGNCIGTKFTFATDSIYGNVVAIWIIDAPCQEPPITLSVVNPTYYQGKWNENESKIYVSIDFEGKEYEFQVEIISKDEIVLTKK